MHLQICGYILVMSMGDDPPALMGFSPFSPDSLWDDWVSVLQSEDAKEGKPERSREECIAWWQQHADLKVIAVKSKRWDSPGFAAMETQSPAKTEGE